MSFTRFDILILVFLTIATWIAINMALPVQAYDSSTWPKGNHHMTFVPTARLDPSRVHGIS